jgi:hypothetical protein
MPPKSYTPPSVPDGVMNKTDHDSRMMRTEGQPTMQGYNAHAAVTRGQIIVAAEIAVESPDFGHLEPTVRAALRELDDAGVSQRPETVLADAGYWHQRQMESVVSLDGIGTADRRKDPRHRPCRRDPPRRDRDPGADRPSRDRADGSLELVAGALARAAVARAALTAKQSRTRRRRPMNTAGRRSDIHAYAAMPGPSPTPLARPGRGDELSGIER